MRTNKNNEVSNTIRFPQDTYKTLVEYKAKFKPYMSLNALIVEAVIEQLKLKTPAEKREGGI